MQRYGLTWQNASPASPSNLPLPLGHLRVNAMVQQGTTQQQVQAVVLDQRDI